MKKILFVGNSFTDCNNLPGMVAKMAESDGVEAHIDAVMIGGAYLREYADENHNYGKTLRAKYAEDKWDAVILQDQSNNPALDPADHLASVKKLASDVFVNGEQIYMYQTWAYQEGSDILADTGLTYEGMRTALRAGYASSAAAVNGIRVPVGDGFALATEKGVEVYGGDAHHPRLPGSYVAACMFFQYLFGKAPTDAYVPERLDAETARIARECAEKSCLL